MGAACQKSAAETFEEEIELPTLSEHKEDGSSAPATARFDGNPDAVYLNCLHPLLIAPADLSDDKGLIGMAAGKEGSVSSMYFQLGLCCSELLRLLTKPQPLGVRSPRPVCDDSLVSCVNSAKICRALHPPPYSSAMTAASRTS